MTRQEAYNYMKKHPNRRVTFVSDKPPREFFMKKDGTIVMIRGCEKIRVEDTAGKLKIQFTEVEYSGNGYKLPDNYWYPKSAPKQKAIAELERARDLYLEKEAAGVNPKSVGQISISSVNYIISALK